MTSAIRNAGKEAIAVRPRGAPARVSPAAGDRLVPRTHLVRRLLAARTAPLVLAVAPAGYGKTALLEEWEKEDDRPFAWVALEEADNDQLRLMRRLVAALEDVTLVREGVLVALEGKAPRRTSVARARIRTAVRQSAQPFVLILDDAQVLEDPDALDVVGTLIDDLCPGSQIVFASRVAPGLPVGRLRAHRKLMEIRPGDLVMTVPEAAALVRASGVELSSDQLRSLVWRTEGWPAGLYLAALAIREETNPERVLAAFAGDDRTVADYLREEFLTTLPPADIAFLTRSAVLQTLSGPLCDAVLERRDSARVLRRLSRMNLLLEPVDRTDTDYRYHRLFAEMLRAELRQREPDQEPALHARASVWYAENGETTCAIDHAIAAGDLVRAGDLLFEHANEYVSYGRNEKVRQWLAQFSEEQIAGSSKLGLAAASSHLAMGNRTLAEHSAAAASRELERGGARQSGPTEAAALLVWALGAPEGIEQMGVDAARAYELGHDGSWWRALACLLMGASAHLAGERESARSHLEEGARRGASLAPSVQVLCLAQLGLLAIEQDDLASCEVLATRARAQVERSGLSDYPTSALVYAVSADVLARLGRVEESRRNMQHADALLRELVDFAPWYEVQCRVAMARAALRLGDGQRARSLLSEASWCIHQVSDATVAQDWLDESQASLEAATDCLRGGRWSLTTAELRVLQFLPTHLSIPEIATRLYVSANTVKTHARAVYRKLDASSRGEAVVRAREAGLLDRQPEVSPPAVACVS